jgi:hypothetical protein
LLLILLFPFLSFSQDWKHFVAGGIIGYATSEIVFYKTKNEAVSVWTGFGMATGAGFAKEGLDKIRGGRFSGGDIYYSSDGGMTGVIIFGVRINFKK